MLLPLLRIARYFTIARTRASSAWILRLKRRDEAEEARKNFDGSEAFRKKPRRKRDIVEISAGVNFYVFA